jgi:hypothetical protein
MNNERDDTWPQLYHHPKLIAFVGAGQKNTFSSVLLPYIFKIRRGIHIWKGKFARPALLPSIPLLFKIRYDL